MTGQNPAESVAVVLVHGAWADGSSWSGVLARLLAAGVDARAVQLPLSSLDDDVAAVRRSLQGVGRAVLVGHSYGGAVITAASAGSSQVNGLVYVSAFVPDAGESVWDLIGQGPETPGAAAGRPTEDGWLWFDRALFPDIFAGDVDSETARVMAAVQGPLAIGCLQQPLAAAGWRELPSWYVRSTADQVIHPDAQARMASRAGADVLDIDGSHATLVSRPDEVATAISAALGRLAVSTAAR